MLDGQLTVNGGGKVNGGAGTMFVDSQGRVISVVALDIAAGEIREISSIVNTEKLGPVGPVGDFRALLRGGRSAD